jgi:hypothetical protein
MIKSKVLDIPKLEPDDWNRWWDIWKEYSKPLVKAKVSPNKESGLHEGFDVFRVKGFSPTYVAPYIDLKTIYPALFQQIEALPLRMYGARFVMSKGNFLPHMDNRWASWSIRSMFHCDDPKPQWYYTSKDGTSRAWLTLPTETNWWAYLDGEVKHGTIYVEEYPKIILQVFTSPIAAKQFVESQSDKYSSYDIQL